MTNNFDFEEISRRCDKNLFMVYFDEALTNRNYILKLRELLENKKLTAVEFKSEVKKLNDELLKEHKKNYKKHFPS